MVSIALHDISKQYHHKPILSHVSLSLCQHERLAIIGRNGAGKSTLLKIISGEVMPDDGQRIIPNNLTICHLKQHTQFKPNLRTKEAITQALKSLKSIKSKFESTSKALQNDPNNASLLQEHANLSSLLDYHHAWDLENKTAQILHTFRLESLQDQLVHSLSGGEQKRVALACLLLDKPDVLLLDEPTNHLDVEMVEFLEDLLLKEKWTLIFISHDRYFVDKIATKILEVEDAKIRSFQGGYQAYLEAKQALLASLSKSHETLLKQLKSEEEWLAKGVRARIKRNEGRKLRIEQMRKQAKANPSVIHKMSLELERALKTPNQPPQNKKKMLFDIQNLSLSLGDNPLFTNVHARILQQDKIAIVGKNGTGKTTFLKILLQANQNYQGKIEFGEAQIGYFDQHTSMLDDNKNLLETFCPLGGDCVQVRGKTIHLYSYLKSFLFPKEDLHKKIGMLSGGEKTRLALALLFTKAYDCLLLDEPTNDLDIPTLNILEEYLQEFQGAVIVVSHDRYFVDKIAQKLFIFDHQQIQESYASYSQYLEIQKELSLYQQHKTQLNKPQPKSPQPKKTTKLSYHEQRQLQLLPNQIHSLEQQIKQLEAKLYDPSHKLEELSKLSEEYESLKQCCEEKITIYLELEEKAHHLQTQSKGDL